MAQEPKRRHSKARKRTRRASISLTAARLINCQNCGVKKLSHVVCQGCGFYAGQAVYKFKTAVKVTKA